MLFYAHFPHSYDNYSLNIIRCQLIKRSLRFYLFSDSKTAIKFSVIL